MNCSVSFYTKRVVPPPEDLNFVKMKPDYSAAVEHVVERSQKRLLFEAL